MGKILFCKVWLKKKENTEAGICDQQLSDYCIQDYFRPS